jgi:hypothetical protein
MPLFSYLQILYNLRFEKLFLIERPFPPVLNKQIELEFEL